MANVTTAHSGLLLFRTLPESVTNARHIRTVDVSTSLDITAR